MAKACRQTTRTRKLKELKQSLHKDPPIRAQTTKGLSDLLAALMSMNMNTKSRKNFKAPKFLGEGNVELFVVQFRDGATQINCCA